MKKVFLMVMILVLLPSVLAEFIQFSTELELNFYNNTALIETEGDDEDYSWTENQTLTETFSVTFYREFNLSQQCPAYEVCDVYKQDFTNLTTKMGGLVEVCQDFSAYSRNGGNLTMQLYNCSTEKGRLTQVETDCKILNNDLDNCQNVKASQVSMINLLQTNATICHNELGESQGWKMYALLALLLGAGGMWAFIKYKPKPSHEREFGISDEGLEDIEEVPK